MKVLVVHNAYRHRGGEDVCVQNESEAMREAGLDVSLFLVKTPPGLRTLPDAMASPWGRGHEASLEKRLEEFRPDVVHAHNLYPLLSARLFKAAKSRGIKTVQTLHNFRPLCLNGLYMTPKLEICERCSPGHYLPGVLRGCYRGSRAQSLGMAAHLAAASTQSWYEDVGVFISPSRFLKEKYERYPAFSGRITVQGHFLPFKDLLRPEPPSPYVLYLGRLSEEKGISWLIHTFNALGSTLKLVVAGTGPLQEKVAAAAGETISYAGYLEQDAKAAMLRRAAAIVIPSECYENFPLTLAEANLLGVPALVADHGGLSERIVPGLNGERYRPRDVDSFKAALGRIQDKPNALKSREICQGHAAEEFSRERFIRRRLEIYAAA